MVSTKVPQEAFESLTQSTTRLFRLLGIQEIQSKGRSAANDWIRIPNGKPTKLSTDRFKKEAIMVPVYPLTMRAKQWHDMKKESNDASLPGGQSCDSMIENGKTLN